MVDWVTMKTYLYTVEPRVLDMRSLMVPDILISSDPLESVLTSGSWSSLSVLPEMERCMVSIGSPQNNTC